MLLPSKAIKEGYHAMRVVTADDKVYLGIKVREVNGLLVIRTPEDKEITIPFKDIAEKGETKSIMPEGLTDTLTKQEFADLVRERPPVAQLCCSVPCAMHSEALVDCAGPHHADLEGWLLVVAD